MIEVLHGSKCASLRKANRHLLPAYGRLADAHAKADRTAELLLCKMFTTDLLAERPYKAGDFIAYPLALGQRAHSFFSNSSAALLLPVESHPQQPPLSPRPVLSALSAFCRSSTAALAAAAGEPPPNKKAKYNQSSSSTAAESSPPPQQLLDDDDDASDLQLLDGLFDDLS